MVLDDSEQRHLDEYKGLRDRLSTIKPDNGKPEIKYNKYQQHAVEYRIEVLNGLIEKLEKKKCEPTE